MDPKDFLNPMLTQNQMLYSFMLMLAMIWAMVWKGLALYKAARQGQKIWFVVLMLVNTVGILEIVYIYLLSGKKLKFKMRTKKADPASEPDKKS